MNLILSIAPSLTAVVRTAPAAAQNYGLDQFAGGAQQVVVVATQQAISSLPPSSGQSFNYEFDSELSTFIPSEVLGPTMFRAAQTLGKGRLNLRVAASYFALSDSLGPIDYSVYGPISAQQINDFYNPQIFEPAGFQIDPNSGLLTRFGLDIDSKVTVLNLAGTYGIFDRLEASLVVPIVINDTHGSIRFLANPGGLRPVALPREWPRELLPGCTAPVPGDCQINNDLREGALVYGERSLAGIRGVDFPEGTNAGVGRISLGVKYALLDQEDAQLAVAGDLFFPSPSEGQLAGPDSGAISPALIGSYRLRNVANLYAEVGYDADFESNELRRFAWRLGTTVPFWRAAADLGLAGSVYNEGIQWAPNQATFETSDNYIIVNGDNRLGATFVDFVAALKVKLAERLAIAGGVVVPLNDEGLRPDALGTLSVEYLL